MRIISQGRIRSVEFSNVAIVRDDNKILAILANQDMLLAEYKTAERAKEVFEELHSEFFDPIVLYRMPEE